MDEQPVSTALADSVAAAAVARETTDKAHVAIVREAVAESTKSTEEAFKKALQAVFSRDGQGGPDGNMYVAVARIPLICKDVLDIKKDMSDMKDNLKWAVRIIIGAVLLAVVASVLKS